MKLSYLNFDFNIYGGKRKVTATAQFHGDHGSVCTKLPNELVESIISQINAAAPSFFDTATNALTEAKRDYLALAAPE